MNEGQIQDFYFVEADIIGGRYKTFTKILGGGIKNYILKIYFYLSFPHKIYT